MTEIEQFLPELRDVDEAGHGRKKDHICVRFLRKKYKCLLVFLIAIISIANTVALAIGFIDKNTLDNITNLLTFNSTAIN